jgi:YbbR domain-containing protein
MRLPGWIRHDLGLKVAALALALFLWVIVSERREVEMTVSLPIKYVDMPSDLTFVAPVPRTADARIRGKGKFLRWRLEGVYFRINLSAATKGIVTHVVSSGEAEIPSGKDMEVLEVIRPKAVRLDLDTMGTRRLPVGIVLKGSVPEDKDMIGKAKSRPRSVVVDGGAKVVDSVDSVKTEPVDLGQLSKKDSLEIKLDLASLPYVTSDVEKVKVLARIEDRKELGIPAVPILAPAGRGEKILFTPDSLDVVISGAESQVDSLDPQELALEVDTRDLPRGQLVFSPEVRNGLLYFKVRSAGQETERTFEVRGRLVAPF